MSPVRRKPPKEVACRRVPNGHSRLNGAAAALFRSVGKLRPAVPEIGVGGRFENGSHAIRCPALGRTRRNGKAPSSSAPPRVRSQWCRRQIAERRAHCTEGAHGTGRAQPHGSLAGASGKDGRTVRPSGVIYAGPSKDPGPAARVPTGDMVVRRHGCQWCASRQRRIGPRSTRRRPGACGPGMNSVRKGISFPLAMAVLESVRHAATEGSAAGGRTMRVRGTGETRSYGVAAAGRARRLQGSASGSPARAGAAASARRGRGWPREMAWRRARGWGTARPVRGGEGVVGARCVPNGRPRPNSPAIPRGCGAGPILRGGSSRRRLARDNYCYQEPIRQFHRFRPAAPRPLVTRRQS